MFKKSFMVPARWVFFLALFTLPIAHLVRHDNIPISLSPEKSPVTTFIVLLFVLGVANSLYQMLCILLERRSINSIQRKFAHEGEVYPAASICSQLCHALAGALSQGTQQNSDTAAEIYHTRLHIKGRLAETLSALLITLGLIGTIIGLINAISGLDMVINNVGVSRENIMSGLVSAMAGMKTAFYTTLYGAVLGGIVLKVLQSTNDVALTELAADLVDFIDHTLTPVKGGPSTPNFSTLQERIDSLAMNMETFSVQLQKADKDLSQLLQTSVHSRLNSIAQQLQECANNFSRES